MSYWLIGLLVIIIVAFFIKVPYDSFPSTNQELFCEDGILKMKSPNNNILQILGDTLNQIDTLSDGMKCSISAEGDLDVTFSTECINNQPTTVCRTQLYKAVIMGKFKPGSSGSPDKVQKKLSEEEALAICKSECSKRYNIQTWQTVDWDACTRGMYTCSCEESLSQGEHYVLVVDIYSGNVISDVDEMSELQMKRGKHDPNDKCW